MESCDKQPDRWRSGPMRLKRLLDPARVTNVQLITDPYNLLT